MKDGHQRISIDVPEASVIALARINRNRTAVVNRAIQAYLDVRGSDKNRYGLDCRYFREKLLGLVSRLDSYTPGELKNALIRLSSALGDDDREAINEEV